MYSEDPQKMSIYAYNNRKYVLQPAVKVELKSNRESLLSFRGHLEMLIVLNKYAERFIHCLKAGATKLQPLGHIWPVMFYSGCS